MALETVFAIIISVAAVGHVASHGEASGIHSAAETPHTLRMADKAEKVKDDITTICIAKTKENFDYANREAEELIGEIEECYEKAEGVASDIRSCESDCDED